LSAVTTVAADSQQLKASVSVSLPAGDATCNGTGVTADVTADSGEAQLSDETGGTVKL